MKKKKQLKILFIEPCHVGFGGYFRAINICTSLSKKDLLIDLLVASKKKFSFKITKTSINKNLNQYELPRFYFHFFINGRILRGLIAFLFGIFNRYDIIHSCVPVQLESNIPAILLKLFGKKVVIDWDDYWEGSAIFGEYKIMKKYVSFCENIFPKIFKNYTVASDFLYNLALERGADKILKIINGVPKNSFISNINLSREKLKLDKDRKYLLTFGHTYTKDRAFYLFKFFEQVYKKDSSIILLFNHDPIKLIAKEDLTAEISIKSQFLKNIKNTGYIEKDTMNYYLDAADATIFLTGNHDNERANFPIRIGTFLSGNSVVIINDINSEASNTLKKYDCAIVSKDYESLATQTVKYLYDESMQKRMHRNVLKANVDLSWDTITVNLKKYYYSLAFK